MCYNFLYNSPKSLSKKICGIIKKGLRYPRFTAQYRKIRRTVPQTDSDYTVDFVDLYRQLFRTIFITPLKICRKRFVVSSKKIYGIPKKCTILHTLSDSSANLVGQQRKLGRTVEKTYMVRTVNFVGEYRKLI